MQFKVRAFLNRVGVPCDRHYPGCRVANMAHHSVLGYRDRHHR